jgi:hypothetical protein
MVTFTALCGLLIAQLTFNVFETPFYLMCQFFKSANSWAGSAIAYLQLSQMCHFDTRKSAIFSN